MRDISTLTPKEGAGLWDAVMLDGFTPFKGSSYKYVASEDTPARFIFMSGAERLCVQFDGKVWADSDLHPLKLDKQTIYQYFETIGVEWGRFSVGDFIRNRKPYEGESEYMVMDIDTKDKCYSLATMKGKHCKKADFENRLLLDFRPAYEFYEKVG